jgi:hypothetical protein
VMFSSLKRLVVAVLAKVTSSQNNRFCNQTAHDERRFDGTRKV